MTVGGAGAHRRVGRRRSAPGLPRRPRSGTSSPRPSHQRRRLNGRDGIRTHEPVRPGQRFSRRRWRGASCLQTARTRGTVGDNTGESLVGRTHGTTGQPARLAAVPRFFAGSHRTAGARPVGGRRASSVTALSRVTAAADGSSAAAFIDIGRSQFSRRDVASNQAGPDLVFDWACGEVSRCEMYRGVVHFEPREAGSYLAAAGRRRGPGQRGHADGCGVGGHARSLRPRGRAREDCIASSSARTDAAAWASCRPFRPANSAPRGHKEYRVSLTGSFTARARRLRRERRPAWADQRPRPPVSVLTTDEPPRSRPPSR